MSSPDSVFASWLTGQSSAEPVELEVLVRAHPDHATALRELHEQWQRLEALRQRFGLSGSLAERLRAVHGSELDAKVELSDEQTSDFTEDLVGRLSDRSPSTTRYRREGELARGGMGAVLAVWDEDLRRRLAMKVLLDEGAPAGERGAPRDKRHLARLLEEAQVTAQLDHPGIVPVHELGLGVDGEVFFTMKLVKGETLTAVFDELAAGEERWTQTRVLGLLVKVCEAMSYAHAKGVIHRDLKPDNVMVGRFGEVYVMDWGLAKVLGREDDKDVRVRTETTRLTVDVQSDRQDRAGESADSPLYTMDGDVVGTPAYMSPEQAAGRVSEMGPPSDVYALGAMLYHLLAGHMPYVPEGARLNNYAVWQRVQEGPPRPLSEVAPEAPAELAAICERAMAQKAGERYEDISALAKDLSAYVEGRVVSAYETGAWAEARKWMKRNKGLAASLAAAVLLLVGGLATTLYLRGEAQANFELAEQRSMLAVENERRALESEAEALRRAGEVLRLSALQDYDELIARVDELWPAHPEKIEAYRAWIDEARDLVADLPLHHEKLGELRARALPQSEEERETERRAWRFPDSETGREARWWHANLLRLIAALEGLVDEATGLLSESGDAVSAEHGWSVPRRLAFAERLRTGLAPGSEWAARWAEAGAAIQEHPDYGGLELAPQVGLVPIGPDPASGLWEFWHVATGAEPERDAEGQLVLIEEVGVVLVLIPTGSFWMGASADPKAERNHDPGAQHSEGPVHEVTLSAYLLSKYELTQGQWSRFTGRNPSYFQPHWDEVASLLHPVEQMSWQDATQELSRMALALPSEAQWEYGCRATTTMPWHFGPDREALRGKVNIADKSAAAWGLAWTSIQDWADHDDGSVFHQEVGAYPPNAWGLHEVHGNVAEWCLDEYDKDADFYSRSPRVDPVAQWEGAAAHVCRGGSFELTATRTRSASRRAFSPSNAGNSLGVRPARVISE